MSPSNEAFSGLQWLRPWDAMLVGALCLLGIGLLGRQTLKSTPAHWIHVGASLDNAGWPPREGSRDSASNPWAARLAPARRTSKFYYLPAELGVHHLRVSGAAPPTLLALVPGVSRACACHAATK